MSTVPNVSPISTIEGSICPIDPAPGEAQVVEEALYPLPPPESPPAKRHRAQVVPSTTHHLAHYTHLAHPPPTTPHGRYPYIGD
jgi:hypothetical protein